MNSAGLMVSSGSIGGCLLSSVAVAVAVNLVPTFPFSSGVTAAHLHCARAGQNGDIILDLAPTTGIVDGELVSGTFTNEDLSSDSDCETTCGSEINNIASLRAAALDDCIYLNVHTESAPDGEARGQLLRLAVTGPWMAFGKERRLKACPSY